MGEIKLPTAAEVLAEAYGELTQAGGNVRVGQALVMMARELREGSRPAAETELTRRHDGELVEYDAQLRQALAERDEARQTIVDLRQANAQVAAVKDEFAQENMRHLGERDAARREASRLASEIQVLTNRLADIGERHEASREAAKRWEERARDLTRQLLGPFPQQPDAVRPAAEPVSAPVYATLAQQVPALDVTQQMIAVPAERPADIRFPAAPTGEAIPRELSEPHMEDEPCDGCGEAVYRGLITTPEGQAYVVRHRGTGRVECEQQ